MQLKHFPITVTPGQCGSPCRGERADLAAYLLDPMPETSTRLRPAVILCPGGGYNHLSAREDQPPAMAYLSMGFQVFVLHYSLAPNRFPRSLMELALAVDLVRRNSASFFVDPRRIMVSGFSAGGHLAASLGVYWNQEFVYGPLGLKAEDIRPDGLVLCYPVITGGAFAHRGSLECLMGAENAGNEAARSAFSLEEQAGPHVPPTFLWHTDTDQTVPVENSLLFASALKRHGVSLELHIFPSGCHGLSLAGHETEGADGKYCEPCCQDWIRMAGRWIESR